MHKNGNYLHLIHHAQLGNQESMTQLTELVQARLFVYIYRLTLDYDLAEDLLQETLLHMVEYLKELEDPNRFWFWLFRTALGKVQHHFRAKKQKKLVQMAMVEKQLSKINSKNYNDGLTETARKELSGAMFESIRKLKIKYRNVLVLRCFEQMPYSNIAVIMNCSELQSRVLFFRAKNLLKKRLARRGFSKAFVLTGLALFGLLTAPAKAASVTTTVSAASMEVGFTASLIGALGGKLGLAIVTAAAAVVVALSIKTVLCIVAVISFTILCLFIASLVGVYDR